MQANAKRPPGPDKDADQGQRQNAAIAAHVLHRLGKPNTLQRVEVRRLWQDHCRVNVLVGEDLISARVAHSYFLVLDADGAVLASTPGITRVYGG